MFPDKLVALTLAASTHPDDVHAARGFLEDNRNLSGSALIDALRATLDSEGRATAKTVPAVADLTAALAQGVRGAKEAAE